MGGRPTPLDVSRDPAPFLREVRARVHRRYRDLVGASRLRAAIRDVWLLAEALAFATEGPPTFAPGGLGDYVLEHPAYKPAPLGSPAFPKPVRAPRPRARSLSGRSAASDNPAYLDAVAALGYCCAGRVFGRTDECSGRLDPHHAGRRPGMGLKAPDDTAIPMCRWHHRALERLFGPFHGWTFSQLMAWREARIAETRAVVMPLLQASTPSQERNCEP